MSGNEAQAELDLDIGEDDGTEVEVTLEEPKQDAANAVEIEVSETEDEFKRSENQTQKRINRLTKKMREAEKSADEATRFAQIKAKENEELAKRLNQMDTSYVDQYSGRVESELSQTEASGILACHWCQGPGADGNLGDSSPASAGPFRG
jgi:hypothetical protein